MFDAHGGRKYSRSLLLITQVAAVGTSQDLHALTITTRKVITPVAKRLAGGCLLFMHWERRNDSLARAATSPAPTITRVLTPLKPYHPIHRHSVPRVWCGG